MIEFDNGGRMVECVEELPDLRGSHKLYLDLETTSGDPRKNSLNPWFDCDILGIAVTCDDLPMSWYVPLRHQHGANLALLNVTKWLEDTVSTCRAWVNHNVKYDAHVLKNRTGIDPPEVLVDTVTQGKIIDSDRIMRGGYSLAALSKGWLHEDIRKYEEALKPYLVKNKDYGAIPADICAEYACQDVVTGRRLFKYENERCPEQCRQVWRTEVALTRVLYDMEQHGMRVEPQELKITELGILRKLMEIDAELAELAGRSFRPHVNEDCFDVLCNQFGLPVVAWTDDGNPSFDKAAMAQYAVHPKAPKDVVRLVMSYRQLNTLNNFFVTKYQKCSVNGRLHPFYNQAIRTGRMSCKEPNAQQLNAAAKRLIHPSPGCSFITADYSQIEFRVIVHYIQDAEAIAAYAENPDTDFHAWVADLCGMKRKPAKTMNFMMGYGGGKKTTVAKISMDETVVGDLQEKIEALIAESKVTREEEKEVFEHLCRQRAEKVYASYHSALPGLKRTARRVSRRVQDRGFVFNAYGRHRHLPAAAAHRGFNTICQSTAADLMKERTVALARACQGTPIKLTASVHDETVLEAPTEIAEDPRVVRDIVNILESPEVELRVPVRCDVGVSDVDWLSASKAAGVISYDKNSCGDLEYLR